MSSPSRQPKDTGKSQPNPAYQYGKAPLAQMGRMLPGDRPKAGGAQPSYGSYQQQGGFPSVPQQGQRPGPDMSAYRQQPGSQTGFRYPSSPPPSMPTVRPSPPAAPVAEQSTSSVQRQIDKMKMLGTWDDPRNAAARARLETKLRNINAAPPGYFITPDGRVEPNYIYRLEQSPAAPMANQSPTGSQPSSYQPIPSQFPPATPPATQYMPQQAFYMPQMDFGTRDAFIQSINNATMQQQMAGFNTPAAAPPQFNFPQLYGQAQRMVANGWSNPLAALLG